MAIAERPKHMGLPDDLPAAMGTVYPRVKDDIYRNGPEKGLPVFDMNAADAADGFTYVEVLSRTSSCCRSSARCRRAESVR